MYIVIAILMFGFLIAVHELGHFTAAKSFGVKVNEFAIGMGPAIFKKQGKETLYSLRILPIGGFCAMEGEDGDSVDPRAFSAQKRWKRLIILAAGAFMNFVVGLIVLIIMFAGSRGFGSNEIVSLAEGFPDNGESGLQVGDVLYSIDGERIYYSSDFATFMQRDKDGIVDVVVKRNGEKISIKNYNLMPREYTENGVTSVRYGISFKVIEGTFTSRLKYSFYCAGNFVRLVRVGLSDLITGTVGVKELSGPVGIVSAINDVGHASATKEIAIQNVAYLCAFVAINLAVMNLLPLPALDGGRIFFMMVTAIIEKISRKRVDPKYEGYIHTAGLLLLMGLMVFVMVNDVIKIFH